MYKLVQLCIPVFFFGLIYFQQVHAIDGDYSNPYATDASESEQQIAVYDGTLNYGGKGAALPLITMVGVGFLVLGFAVVGTILIKGGKQKYLSTS